ncbi:MAG TPA: CAP domain-containing protein [Solirubrobacter sp.]|nr:CAP domain-containing protein [Solirubrobacter sp.]
MFTPAATARTLLYALTATALAAAPAQASRGADRCPHARTIPQTKTGVTQAARATACLVNVERTSRGVPATRHNGDLTRAAKSHTRDMIRRSYFAHTSPAGSDLSDRIRRAGYGAPGDGWRAGENLGWGTGAKATPDALVDAWLDSPPHRRIMLSRTYKELGVGVATGAPTAASALPGATYTLDFATLRPAR